VLGALLAVPLLVGGAPAPQRAARPPVEVGEPRVGNLLVAAHDLTDPNFFRSVVLLLHRDEAGTKGLIVNRPLAVRPIDALPGVEGLDLHPEPLYQGGPVARDGYALLLLGRPVEGTRPIVEGVHLGSTLETLERVATDARRQRFRLYVGHAGWAPGQLEAEIARGAWYLVDGSSDVVFTDDPAGVWNRLAPDSANWVRQRPSARRDSGGRLVEPDRPLHGAGAGAPWISSSSNSNTSVAPGRISGGKPVSP